MTRAIIPYTPLTELSRRRIDVLRGFLCFYVFCFHFYVSLIPHSVAHSKPFDILFFNGYIAVDVFFALSGFLVSHSLAKRISQDGQIHLIPYFLRRFFRTIPTWFVVLLITLIFQKALTFGAFSWNFFFVFALRPFWFSEIAVIQSWSLYVEEIFYITFPLFLVLIQRRLTVYAAIVFLLGSAIVTEKVQLLPNQQFYTSFNTFHFFGFGIAAYWFIDELKKLSANKLYFGLCVILRLGTATLVMDKKLFLLAEILLSFIFLLAPAMPLDRIADLIFLRLGKQCYSFYLVHMLAIETCKRVAPYVIDHLQAISNNTTVILFLIATPLALSMSWLLHLCVENPFMKLGRRLDLQLAHRCQKKSDSFARL